MDNLHFLIESILTVLKMTIIYITILMGPGIIMAVFLHYIHKFIELNALTLFGRKLYLVFFAGIGTIVHEIGHAIMCFPFGHKIIKMELFNPDQNTGTLGYVKHSYNPKNKWAKIGNFFIGIGPVIIGSIIVYFSAYYLVSKTFFIPFENLNISFNLFTSFTSFRLFVFEVGNSFIHFFDSFLTFKNLNNWQFWFFLYIAITIGGSMTLSPADIKGAASGFSTIVGIFIIISIITLLFGGSINTAWLISISKNYSIIYSIMLLAIGINLLILVTLFILRKIIKG